MKAIELLEEAKRVLESGGWTQGTYESDIGEHCAVGALRSARDGALWFEYEKALLAFEEIINSPNIVAWNDDPNRRVNEVYAAFDRAIALLSK